jgi:hypothetical protein
MVPGMENTPNWMLWLLVGLAIIPMLIPAQRRYQVLRLRLTAARLRGFQNRSGPVVVREQAIPVPTYTCPNRNYGVTQGTPP